MYRVKDVTTQQGLGELLFRMQKKPSYQGHSCVLSVNDTARAAKLIRKRYQKTKFDNFFVNINDDLTASPIDFPETRLLLDIIVEIFEDRNRIFFSKSRRMMKRIVRHAKS